MLKYSLMRTTLFVGLLTSLMISCSSGVKKAEIPSTANPQEEISKLNNDIRTAVTKNIDVLAPSEFNKSVSSLDEAKDNVRNGRSQEKTIEAIRVGRGYLEKAYTTSENRESKAVGLFESRQLALKAGAADKPELREELQSLDKEVSSKADSLEKLSTEQIGGY